ncbi:hypothetical protein J5U23_02104 [Saccharolobus shibatae B12]|uniref:Uncharacterized protein n=2 Tax=Saccharolobus shibatae TaxID=2286 RepID=A0A8F5BW11_9CREN|nr:hypothetical protein J5U23_02104 [Saccharolobus shibatae B12]QXJ32481.1 hypothetical protein J5U21_02132 [Saccharolobus shibatae]QXJ35613.1 hypothetical protein J5U22_02160 [Saccharolobus shibatae]
MLRILLEDFLLNATNFINELNSYFLIITYLFNIESYK